MPGDEDGLDQLSAIYGLEPDIFKLQVEICFNQYGIMLLLEACVSAPVTNRVWGR